MAPRPFEVNELSALKRKLAGSTPHYGEAAKEWTSKSTTSAPGANLASQQVVGPDELGFLQGRRAEQQARAPEDSLQRQISRL